MNEKMKRMKELIDLLTKASIAYYQNSEPIMTDFEYDKLYDELVELEKETNTVLSNSPTIRVEPEIQSSLQTVEHPAPMLSLGKTKALTFLFFSTNCLTIVLPKKTAAPVTIYNSSIFYFLSFNLQPHYRKEILK